MWAFFEVFVAGSGTPSSGIVPFACVRLRCGNLSAASVVASAAPRCRAGADVETRPSSRPSE
jgi:hypothetical protein